MRNARSVLASQASAKNPEVDAFLRGLADAICKRAGRGAASACISPAVSSCANAGIVSACRKCQKTNIPSLCFKAFEDSGRAGVLDDREFHPKTGPKVSRQIDGYPA